MPAGVDDGSRDASADIAEAATLPPTGAFACCARAAASSPPSTAVGLAGGAAPLVARMDADDLALPARLARQAAALDETLR
ncbi:MAG: hypothetical protein U0802_02365 [Candidatus Binatia bacterium]